MADKVDELHKIFDALVKAFDDKLKKPAECSSADLNIIRQFLRDNNISATDPRGNKPLQNLTEKMPFDDNADPASVN